MNLHIAFSGGRTSAFMTKWLLENKAKEYDQVKIVFANTGQEHEKTLEFVQKCSENFGFNVVWVEALVPSNEKGVGTSHKIVNFETASRNGEPFEAVIKKFGIPNQTWQFCSRELKQAAVRSYLRSVGWKKKDYVTALGIRHDEAHRVSSNMVRDRLIYPLIEWVKVDKEFIRNFWFKQSFDLDIKEHYGNCVWCWKKSKRKLLTLAKEDPSIFDFPKKMEELYGDVGLEEDPRVFFRGRTSTNQIIEESKNHFVEFSEKPVQINIFDDYLDAPGGCSESCDGFN